MADSYRLTVLKRLTDHLKGTTPENNYEFDLSDSVFRGRTTFGANDPIPMIAILENPRPDTGSYAGDGFEERKEFWSLLIQGWVDDDMLNPTDPAYALLDAVEHRLARLTATHGLTGNPLYPDEYLLGRSVADVMVLPGVCRPPMEQVSSKAFFYLPVRLTLVRNTG